MRRILVALVGLCLAPSGSSRAEEPTGREIMQEQERRHQAAAEATRFDMTLVDRRGKTKERVMVVTSQEQDGLTKLLLKFLSPGDIRNVGLLTWEQPGEKEDDQWLHLPALRQVKRIGGGSKKNLFMGTDLAYEDLRPEELDTHDYRLTGSEDVDGQDCWIVEALPATDREKKDSGYGKRILRIRKDTYFTVAIDFYNQRDKLIKTAVFEELKPLGEEAWRADRLTYSRPLQKTSTILVTVSRDLEPKLAETTFTQQNLKRPPVEK